ncbi:MAG: PDZ domain-containing protein [Mariniblastus sp.]
MKKVANLLVALAATLTMGALANAQQTNFAQQGQTQTGQAQLKTQVLVGPQVGPQISPIQPVQQNQFYFGMRVELVRSAWGQTTLRIVGVTPGSPAQQAGLEFGDEITTVNGRGFSYARDNFDAVRLMNQFVSFTGGGGGAPAVAAGGGVQAMVAPGWPSPQRPTASMVVRNVRNGQLVNVTVFPQRRFGGGAPAAAAAMTNR